jgi:hypothetical protein
LVLFLVKNSTSFFEKKEAKKLLPLWTMGCGAGNAHGLKEQNSFFQKRTA